jgi:hypothetical protein
VTVTLLKRPAQPWLLLLAEQELGAEAMGFEDEDTVAGRSAETGPRDPAVGPVSAARTQRVRAC